MAIIFLSKTIPDNADMPCDRRFTNLETLKSDSWQKLRWHRIMEMKIFNTQYFGKYIHGHCALDVSGINMSTKIFPPSHKTLPQSAFVKPVLYYAIAFPNSTF